MINAQQLDEMTPAERLAMDEKMTRHTVSDWSTYSRESSSEAAALDAIADDWPCPPYTEDDERDPTGRSPHSAGAKLDAGKAPVLRGAFQYFPRALEHVARVSAKGAAKYAWNGWEDVPDGFNRYSDAMGRHILKEITEGDYDIADTGELHAAQVAWNALARLELKLREQEQQK
jgi:hypothetical protein